MVESLNDFRQARSLEIEWNNKDPFFGRDLENYKRLHADGAISLGILIKRGILRRHSMRSMIVGFADDNNIEEERRITRMCPDGSRPELFLYAFALLYPF